MSETNIVWLVVVGVIALATVAVAAYLRFTRARTGALRERFGPEYGRVVAQYGGKRRGERALAARAERVEQTHILELSDADRARFTSSWSSIQGKFVDDPRGAVEQANDLITQVMRARGYAEGDAFDQRAADLSVDHPDVVQHYRAARDLARAGMSQGINTEELRQAVMHYRVIFADLLQPARPAMPGPQLSPAPA